MKKVTLIILLLISSGIYMTSCNKEEELKYSCDPVLNQWATDNARTLSVSTRDEIVQYLTIDSQFAAYRTLRPANQCNVWKDKLRIVSNTFSLSTAEKDHINTAYNYLQPSMFDGESNISALKTWAEAWKAYGVSKFGWSAEYCYLIAGTWLTPQEIDKYKAYRYNNSSGGGLSTGPNASGIDCECYYSLSCSVLDDGSCIDGGCNKKIGCGVFGTSNCTGRCK